MSRRLELVLIVAIVPLMAGSLHAAESVRVGDVGGHPGLLIDDSPTPPHMFFNTSWNPEVVADDLAQSFADVGIHLHQFDVNLDWSPDYDRVDLAATGGRHRSVDERLAAIVGIDDEALVLLRVHLNPPLAWDEEHPDEILTAEDGTRIVHGKWSASVSYASGLWREEAGKRLAALIEHLRRSGLEKHVLGYLLFAGWTGEWNFFRQERGDLPGARFAQLANMATDHSPAMREAFRAYLREEHRTDAALGEVWRSETVSLDSVGVPTEDEVYAGLPEQLNDPRSCAPISEYFACVSRQVSDSLLHFARVAKACSSNRICGAFFGEYLFAAIGGNRALLRIGHGDFDRVVRSPDIDFVVTPNCYQSRGVGGHSPSMTLVDSAQRHGKLVWYEYDQPTHLATRDGAPRDMSETRAVMRRGFAYCLCENLGIWWWDQESRWTNAVAGGVWYRDPEIRREFAEYQRVWRRAIGRDRSSIAEIAVIYDPTSCLYQRPAWKDFTRDLIYAQADALGKLGAPHDIFSLSDLDRAAGYKLYVVWNALHLTDKQLARLRRLTHRRGVTTVWCYAPGYLGPQGRDVSRTSSLVGMDLREILGAKTAAARMLTAEGLAADAPFGSEVGFSPLFAVADPEHPLAVYDLPDAPVAAAIRERDGRRSVYLGAAPVPPELLRHVARLAGVHQYVDGDDVVYANASYLGLHAAAPGERSIHLPRRATVRDALTGELLATDTDHLTVTFSGPETRLFEVR